MQKAALLLIKMQNKDSGRVVIDIFNIKGQKVKTIFDANTSKGEHEMTWEGKDKLGKRVASGVYTIIMKINVRIIETQKVTIIK